MFLVFEGEVLMFERERSSHDCEETTRLHADDESNSKSLNLGSTGGHSLK